MEAAPRILSVYAQAASVFGQDGCWEGLVYQDWKDGPYLLLTENGPQPTETLPELDCALKWSSMCEVLPSNSIEVSAATMKDVGNAGKELYWARYACALRASEVA